MLTLGHMFLGTPAFCKLVKGPGVGGERGILRGVTWKRTQESSSQRGERETPPLPTTPNLRRGASVRPIRLLRLFLDVCSLQLGNSEVLGWIPTGESQMICKWPTGGPLLIWEINCTSRGQQAQLSSIAQLCRLFAAPWTAARQGSLSIINSWS